MDDTLLPAHDLRLLSLTLLIAQFPTRTGSAFIHNATAKERGYNMGAGIGDTCAGTPFDPQTEDPREV